MEPPSGRDSRFNLGYSMNLLSGETPPEIYGGSLGRPSTSLQQLSPRHTMVSSACGTRGGIKSDVCYDDRGMPSQQNMGFEASGVNDMNDDSFNSMQGKKSPPSNGKKTKGRVKIKMEYIENKLRRYTTFSKRKTGIMKKAYELSTLTGTQVMLLVASETGHVYTFATRKLQPMITSEAGKALIQTCLNSPDPPVGSAGGDQRMSATGFEETELTYNISDEDSKEIDCDTSGADDDEELSEEDESEPPEKMSKSDYCKHTEKMNSQESQKSSDTPSNSDFRTSSKKEELNSKTSFKPNKSDDLGNSKIINQIEKLKNDVIQSNRAKAASAAINNSGSSTNIQPAPVPSLDTNLTTAQVTQSCVTQLMSSSVTTAATPQVSIALPGDIKAVPVLVQTASGVSFAGVSDGMILGMIQGSSEPKLVAMPLSSLTTNNIAVTSTNVKHDDIR